MAVLAISFIKMNRTLLKRIIGDYFSNEKWLHIEKLKGGLTNHNYRLRMANSESYFLKIFRKTEITRIIGISALIKGITDFHFPTPELIICKNGEYYWQDGIQSAIITRFIEGEYPRKNTTNLYKIGVILGMLHQIPVKAKLVEGYSLQYSRQKTILEQNSQILSPDLLEFLNIADPILQTIPKTGFPESIIHGDVFLDNLLINEFGDIFFIDFEGGCIDKSIFDLARAFIGCAIENKSLNLNYILAMVTGYNISRKLSPLEHDFLFEYIVYAGTISSLWRFIEFNIMRTNENKSHLYKELLEPTLRFVQTGKKSFLKALYENQQTAENAKAKP